MCVNLSLLFPLGFRVQKNLPGAMGWEGGIAVVYWTTSKDRSAHWMMKDHARVGLFLVLEPAADEFLYVMVKSPRLLVFTSMPRPHSIGQFRLLGHHDNTG